MMAKVVDENGWLLGVSRVESPDHGGTISPEAIVLHYTGGGSAKGSIDWLSKKDEVFVSAHLVIDRNGSICQLVPFDREAWHAGVSAWQGRKSLNKWSIGIEMANFGPLVSAASGYAKTSTGNLLMPREVYSGPHSNSKCQSLLWEAYPHVQVLSCLEVCRALIEEYGIQIVVGHSDVAPDRKIDPGPAFPMEAFKKCLF
ncbi:MAG: N-acetylmuramoyl-L-alanine amidase [Candidatus Paceibacterota bacterium]|jgi:N-acetylmuramoyl-L-alanine amidase